MEENETRDRPCRKQIRLPAYDYSAPGAYFVTICTKNRCCVLSSIRRGDPCGRPELRLLPCGKIAEQAFETVERLYGASFDHYVVMPNHVHFICRIQDARATARVAPTLGRIVGAYKSIVVNNCRKAGLNTALWQRNYHEHVIRNDTDYREIWNYIDNNPAQWVEDSYYTRT